MTLFNKKLNAKHSLLIATMVLIPSLLLTAYCLNKNYLYSKSADELDNLIEVFISNLKGEIEKFSFLPDVLSADPNINALLGDPENPQLINIANSKLEQVNEVSKASDIYIMDKRGVTIAASNWKLDYSFVGKNFSFRPYFKEAIDGKQGRYFAYGTTSRQRGYYFSSPIYDDQNLIVGIIVVKVSMDRLEKAWKDYENDILIGDENGVIFSTIKPHWLFVQLDTLTDQAKHQILRDKQYPLELLKPALVTMHESYESFDKVNIVIGDINSDFLRVRRDIPELNWRVYAIQELTPLQQSIYLRMVVIFFVCVILSALFYAIALRRKSLKEQLAYRLTAQAQLIEARDKLELRVIKRTQAITLANQELQLEIDERQKAELELRQAQEELIHATRLATIGQLSAGITHELSQPLAAITSYAENAISFLDGHKSENASENLIDILRVCERMSLMTTHLKSYSRKTTEELEAVNLAETVNNALALLNVRFREQQVEINNLQTTDLFVLANQVRLEQVFVNIFSNALDAMKNTTHPKIEIRQDHTAGYITTVVSDNGSGIDVDNLNSIFDPFFTTKEIGVGLGLGLSISHAIIKKFGGNLYAFNNQDAGASFSVRLLEPDK